MATEPDWEGINRRLDIIILLLMENSQDAANSTTRKVEKLMNLGMSATEVARIVGKKSNYVSAVVAAMRRSSAKKKGNVKSEEAGDE